MSTLTMLGRYYDDKCKDGVLLVAYQRGIDNSSSLEPLVTIFDSAARLILWIWGKGIFDDEWDLVGVTLEWAFVNTTTWISCATVVAPEYRMDMMTGGVSVTANETTAAIDTFFQTTRKYSPAMIKEHFPDDYHSINGHMIPRTTW